jgi:hypothetical protein
MINHYLKTAFLFALLLSVSQSFAGNPDRQGEAGAYELLMNPWARSAGLSSMTVSNVTGVEAMRINIAGLSRINKTEIAISHTDYLTATNTKINAFGIGQKVGKNGTLGLSLMAIDFGEIDVTTTEQPDGTGGTYEPTFFNIGIGYSYIFDNKISVGFTFRVVSESNSEISGMGVAIDAGVQYVTGERDNFKFGICLRNVGTKMRFSGQGLSIRLDPDDNGPNSGIVLKQDAATFELPSLLNIGISNDFRIGNHHRITALVSFTGNSFSRDQIGGGLEYSFRERFMLRAGYRAEIGSEEDVQINNVYSGLSVGATFALPMSKKNKDTQLLINYAYRTTEVFDGTHNFGVTIAM